MTMFIAPIVSDDLGAYEHLGIYIGIYKLLAYTMHVPWEKSYEKLNAYWVLAIATGVFESGLVCSAFAQKSIWFAVGRGISGIGAAGITTYPPLSDMNSPSPFGFHYTTRNCRLLLAVLELLAYALGPL